ncbi:MAG: protein translocase subunit SecD [Planctomycetota bacterium]|jgi:SecD/SecF fusion protein
MNDPNRVTKWIMILGFVALALWRLNPPSRTLKGGIDLVGGTSMLLEIDTTGMQDWEISGLATKVMDILKDRVDPKGQLNLEWRPVGDKRLEIRMPRPPKEALQRRQEKEAALDAIASRNLKRFDIVEALSATAADRANRLASLAGSSEERRNLLDELSQAFDAKIAADGSDNETEKETATARYEDAMNKVLATNAPINRLVDILTIGDSPKRDEELTRFRNEFPAFDAGQVNEPDGMLITKATTAFDAWAKNKADLEDPSDLKRRIRGAGVLEFRILAERDRTSPTNINDPKGQGEKSIEKFREELAKRGPRMREGDRFGWFAMHDPVKFLQSPTIAGLEDVRSELDNPSLPVIAEYAGRFYVLGYNSSEERMLRGTDDRKWQLKTAFPDRDPASGKNVVSFVLDARGGREFGRLTGGNVDRDLCIMLDNEAVSYANILERITERCQIRGNFSTERVNDLVTTLNAGSLPARLKEQPLMEKTIGPSLGEANRTNGTRAAMGAGLAVAVFVLLYYGIAAGGMANIALALNLLFVLAVMAFLQATFTLPGIAGLILTVGMAIDANVLIFERIREERNRGVIFKKALNTGYDKAFSTIMDANLTTLLTCIILGFVGSEEVKGFAITLGIGIVTSMFTSLFVTRLAFNTLISKNKLHDLRMWSLVGVPTVDWLSLRTRFWPVSISLVTICAGIFIFLSNSNKEAVYDIEFLGGTAVQVDLKPGVEMSPEEMDESIKGQGTGGMLSAKGWLEQAADKLANAQIEAGGSSQSLVARSADGSLTGEQLGVLLGAVIEDRIENDGVRVIDKNTVAFEARAGQLDVESLRGFIADAQERARQAAVRLSKCRTQSVAELDSSAEQGVSYEVVTIETNRALVKSAILAAMGDRLEIQRKLQIDVVNDDEFLNEPYFIVETDDAYLSDVVGGSAQFDIRRYRGGVSVQVVLGDDEPPVTTAEMERRLREHSLQVGADSARTLDTAVFPLGDGNAEEGYRRFAFVAVDESVLYDEVGEELWKDALAEPFRGQVTGALASEKSLSKVLQFAPQVADQARQRALMAIVLALFAIVVYLSLRFGTKEYGLAAIVALVHDVSITLGLVALFGFRVDLPMIAAILTVIGYSLNDTIVVFDRIRENRGRVGKLQAGTINNSINQTLSRTLLTSVTTFLAVGILFVWGGAGVSGFSFALMIGVIVGTYSSLGVATPLLYKPVLLHKVIGLLMCLAIIGLTLVLWDEMIQRIVGVVLGLIVLGFTWSRSRNAVSSGRPAMA